MMGLRKRHIPLDLRGVDRSKIIAILHTHPRELKRKSGRSDVSRRAQQWNVSPGSGDFGYVARGIPNYIEHEGRIGVLELVDGQWQFRMIKGEIFDDGHATDENRLIQNQIDTFQRTRRGLK